MTDEEKQIIERELPPTITRRWSERKLSYSLHDDGTFWIWYGTIISGNYVAQHKDSSIAIKRMKEYIEKYKDMDELTFQNLGIKKGICLNCHVPLVKVNPREYYCPECMSCYDKSGLIGKIQMFFWIRFIKKLAQSDG